MEIQLDFINQAFVELLSEDGLIILARWELHTEVNCSCVTDSMWYTGVLDWMGYF